eukprot:COSAG01_NODE_73118_length_251_cov_0.671053_1_plen_23_part_01
MKKSLAPWALYAVHKRGALVKGF